MTEPLTISVQGTPNPNAAKFTLNRVVASQGKTYRLPAPPQNVGGAQAGDAASAELPWAQRVLKVVGVTQVFVLNNFVSVTKTAEADWQVIAPQVQAILTEVFR